MVSAAHLKGSDMANNIPLTTSRGAPDVFAPPPNRQLPEGYSDLSAQQRGGERKKTDAARIVPERVGSRSGCFGNLFSCGSRTTETGPRTEMEDIVPIAQMRKQTDAIVRQGRELQVEIARIKTPGMFTREYREAALAPLRTRAIDLTGDMRAISERMHDLGEHSTSGRLPQAWQSELDRGAGAIKQLQRVLKN